MDQFSQQYNKLVDYIYGYLQLRVNDQKVAEDLTSKTFLTAIENKDRYEKEKGSWRQWVTGIAKNCLLNHWRSNKIELSLDDLEKTNTLIHSSPPPSEKIDQEILFEKILDQVSSKIRSLLILRYVDDLSHEEIAEITHKTPAAIRKSFSRIHKTLREKLTGDNSIL